MGHAVGMGRANVLVHNSPFIVNLSSPQKEFWWENRAMLHLYIILLTQDPVNQPQILFSYNT